MAVVIFQAFLAGLSLEMLSSVRAYVGGEGLWSKSQKDAIHFISVYSQTGDEQFFDRFKKAIAIPLSDRAARRRWSSRPPIWMPPETACWEEAIIPAIFPA